MFSVLRKGLIYENLSSDIVEHDLDIDADQWSYDQHDVYRGAIDSNYIAYGLNVHWLYDDDSKRVGLAEHDSSDLANFTVLWFYDNPFATFFQNEAWKSSGTTLWSKLSNEAYQDCLETDFKYVSDLALSSGVLLMTPEMIVKKPDLYTCEECGKKSLMKSNVCSTASVSDLDFSQFSILFLDDDFVLYDKPILLQPQHDASVQEQLVVQQSSPGLEEFQGAETPQPQAAQRQQL
jgi:hypothetical protein